MAGDVWSGGMPGRGGAGAPFWERFYPHRFIKRLHCLHPGSSGLEKREKMEYDRDILSCTEEPH